MKGLFTHRTFKLVETALFDGKNYWELKKLENKYGDLSIRNLLSEDIKFSSYDIIKDCDSFFHSLSLQRVSELTDCPKTVEIYTVNGQTACMRYSRIPCFDSYDYEYDGDFMLFFIAGEKSNEVDGLAYRGGYKTGSVYYCSNLYEAPEYIKEEIKNQKIVSPNARLFGLSAK